VRGGGRQKKKEKRKKKKGKKLISKKIPRKYKLLKIVHISASWSKFAE